MLFFWKKISVQRNRCISFQIRSWVSQCKNGFFGRGTTPMVVTQQACIRAESKMSLENVEMECIVRQGRLG